MNTKRIVIVASIVLIVLIVPSIFIGSTAWFYVESRLFGEDQIQRISAEIVANQTDPIKSLNKLADWVTDQNNIHYDAHLIYFYPIPPFWLFRIPDPAYIMVTRRGGCGETAILFNAMANSVGITTRMVHNPGEDHAWCEVFVNGSWLHFDPGLSEEYRFNDPHFYERSSNGWGKPLSHVYALDSNGTEMDVTNKYTDTGKLSVFVVIDDLPIENAKVTIKSRSLMDNFGYSEPGYCMEKYTNSSGLCEFDLGGNNYTIIAESGIFFGSRAEIIHQVTEHNSTMITLNPSGFVLLPPIENVAILVEVVFLCSLVMIMFFRKLVKTYMEQWQNR
jgi:hypothetical protein